MLDLSEYVMLNALQCCDVLFGHRRDPPPYSATDLSATVWHGQPAASFGSGVSGCKGTTPDAGSTRLYC